MILKIWKDCKSEKQKIIESTWIFDNLFLDLLMVRELIDWKSKEKDHLFFVSLSITEFFLNGIQFQFDQENNPKRQKYFLWIYQW